MTHAAVAADFNQALDIELFLTAQIAFHREVLADVITQRGNFALGEVFDARVGIHLCGSQNFL